MKKLLGITLVAMLATISQAASITWGSNGTTDRFLQDVDGGVTSANRLPKESIICLIYLGTGTSVTFDNKLESYSEETIGDAISGGTVYTTGALTAGGTYSKTFGGTEWTTDKLNGNYAILYFNATSWDDIKKGTEFGITTDVTSVSLAAENDQTGKASLKNNVGLTGVIVPEPSTAALALAGLALLLKRRKA